MKSPQIAFVHEWLVTKGGSEAVLEAMLEIWPDAPVYTLVYDQHGPCKQIVENHQVKTSFIQKLPWSKRNHRVYLPLMPLAIEQFDLRDYDIIVSCSHAVAHGIIPHVNQLHINNICIPVRYAWHLYHQYLDESGLTHGVRGAIAKLILHYLRIWDVISTNRVDYYVAISTWVAQNVWRTYRRHADVIYPPVDIKKFQLNEGVKDDFFLTMSRMVPYKKIDMIVNAFSKMPNKKLFVIGDGPDADRIMKNAGRNVQFLGFQPQDALIDYMQRAKAFIFASEEDFGIVPVEAQACGTPVIAYGKGGALETVIDGKTGLFFEEQTAKSLIEAVNRFENGGHHFSTDDMRHNAKRFSKERFKREFKQFVEDKWEQFQRENTPT